MSKIVDSEYGFYINGIFYPGHKYVDNTQSLVSDVELIDNGLGFLNESEIEETIQAILKLKENLLSVLPKRSLLAHTDIDSNIPNIPSKGYFMYQNLLFYNLAIFTGIVLQVGTNYYGNYYINGKFKSGINGLTTISGKTYYLVNGSMNYSTGYAATNYNNQINYLYATGGQPYISSSSFYYDFNREIVLLPTSTLPNQSKVILFNPNSVSNYSSSTNYEFITLVYLGVSVLFSGQNGGYAFTGIYNNEYYKNGVLATGTFGGLFYFNGTLYTGFYKNNEYIQGVIINNDGIFSLTGQTYTEAPYFTPQGYSQGIYSQYNTYSYIYPVGTYTFTITGGSKFIYFLLIGGGGGGGGGNTNGDSAPGGGGGGGLYYNTTYQIFPEGTYTITVPSGGAGGNIGYSGSNGGAASIIGNGIYISTPGGNGGGVSLGIGNSGLFPGTGGASINSGTNNSLIPAAGISIPSGAGGYGYGSLIEPTNGALISIGGLGNFNAGNSGGGGGGQNTSGTSGDGNSPGINGYGTTNSSGGDNLYNGGGGGGCTGDCRNPALTAGLRGGNGGLGAVYIWFNT